MIMLFKKKNEEVETYETNDDKHTAVLEALVSICEDGVIYEDAFILEDEGIYVYADILSLKNNVAQIMFQIHHDDLEEPIMEAIAMAGETSEEAIVLTCTQFYKQVLSIYVQAIHEPFNSDVVEGFTQERHYFHVYRSSITGIGKREGTQTTDFWDMLKEDIAKRLGNKRVYWVKIFASKKKEEVHCEVRINGREAIEISKKLCNYALKWDCTNDIHTEKQGVLLVQDKKSYEQSDFRKEEIMKYTEKAIPLYEKCKDREAYKKIKEQLSKWCKDDSLACEIFAFIPELYCQLAHPDIEYGEKLFLIQKGKETRELYQGQLQSFAYVEEVVQKHFETKHPDKETLQQVLKFSINHTAIQKSIEQGDSLENLYVSGIGYLGCQNYQLR